MDSKKETIMNNGNINHAEFIDYKSFEHITPLSLGEGSNKVFMALWDQNKISICLKTLRSDDENVDRSVDERLVNELMSSRINCHANIIKVFGLCQTPKGDTTFIVMQYANGGTLRQHLQQKNIQHTWDDTRRIMNEISMGLHCIHSEGMAHKNLHPNNILVHNGHIMITDLVFSDKAAVLNLDERIAFLEPMYLQNQAYQRDKRSDIYSLGVIMYEVSSGRPPFESTGSDFHQLLSMILNNERELSIIPNAPLPYVQLYRHCWDYDPIRRPTIEQVLYLLGRMSMDLSSNKSPPISPRVDSIGWRNSMIDYQEYIDKSKLREYSVPKPSFCKNSPLLNTRRHGRAPSMKHLKSSSSCGNFHSIPTDIGRGVINNCTLFDNRQPDVILVALYSSAKSIVSILDLLKKKRNDLTERDIFNNKSVFHSLIWNDHLFDMTFGYSRKSRQHNSFRAVIHWLITNDLDINAIDDFGWTALHEAIWKRKDPGVVSVLLENKLDPNIPDNAGLTPLHQCLDLLRKTTRDDENNNIFAIIKLLLHYGANPNSALPENTLTISGVLLPNCLFAAVYLGLPLEIIELMIKLEADASTTFRGLYLRDFAAKVNNTLAFRYLSDRNLLTNKRANVFNPLKAFTKVIPVSPKLDQSKTKKRWSIATLR